MSSDHRDSRLAELKARLADWRLHGLLLMTISIVATMWLAVSGQLILYIHPRYVVFTVIMAVIGLAFVIASFARRSAPADAAEHDHDHDHEPSHVAPPPRYRRVLTVVGTVLTVGLAATLILLPPATLTSATANQRAINSTGVPDDAAALDAAQNASDAAVADFTVLDWASLLRQTSDPSFYAGKDVDVIGFVTEDPADPDNVFYLSRFVITCCAVDAQPIGVPVYLENWRDSFALDQWVQATGSFETNPSRSSEQPIALVPADVVGVEQPAEPYVY